MKIITYIIEKIKTSRLWRYGAIALLLHALVLLIIGPKFVVEPYIIGALFKGSVKNAPPPPKKEIRQTRKEEQRQIKEVPVNIMKKPPKAKRIMIEREMKTPTFTRPPAELTPRQVKPLRTRIQRSEKIIRKQKARRRKTYRKFAKQFKVKGKGRQTKAVFTPVLARYQGGDWNKDPTALSNLMREINRRSNIKAGEKPKVVSVSSDDIFKYPFVFFTGTEDFSLTSAEVEILRKYLLKGGLVWADNGLPGRRSRFDIAFRREMKRVLPDRDFEPITVKHKIFSAFYSLAQVPSAMNFRHDPIEIIKMDTRVLAVYTMNDYSDFWETQLDEKGEVDDSWNEDWTKRLWGPHWDHNVGWGSFRRYTKYENLNQETVDNAYKLGVNIIAYLLTR